MKSLFFYRIFLSFIMLFISVSFNLSFSQTKKDAQKILMSKTWCWYEEGYKDGQPQLRFIFTKDSITSYVVGNKAYDNMKATIPYYLGDQKNVYFDDQKVGKVKNGKYIIEKLINEIYIMEIISIDKNEIKFKAPTNDGDVIRIYRAVD